MGTPTDLSDLDRTAFAEDRSDNLVFLRDAVEWARKAKLKISALPRLDLVVDSNCALKEIARLQRLTQPNPRTALQEVADAGIVRLFAPRELDIEVRRNIPEFAATQKLPELSLVEAWERYKGRLRLFAPEPADGVTIRHANDLPFLYALHVIGGDGILTDDLDIVSSGVPVLNPALVHRPLRQFARKKSVSLRMGAQSFALSRVAGEAISGTASAITRKPWLLLIAGVGVGVVYWMHRRQVSKTGSSFLTDASSIIKPALLEALEKYGEAALESTKAWEEVEGAIGPRKPRSIEQSLTASLLWSQNPMSEDELVTDVIADGRHQELGEALRNHVTFALRMSRRFQFDGRAWTLANRDAGILPRLLSPTGLSTVLQDLPRNPSRLSGPRPGRGNPSAGARQRTGPGGPALKMPAKRKVSRSFKSRRRLPRPRPAES
jgi:hypothetical protein